MELSNTTQTISASSSTAKKSLCGNFGSTRDEDDSSLTTGHKMEEQVVMEVAPSLRVPLDVQYDYLESNREKDNSKPLLQRLAMLKKLFQRKHVEKNNNEQNKQQKRHPSNKPVSAISLDKTANSSIVASLQSTKPTLPLPAIGPRAPVQDPHEYMDEILAARGYATKLYPTLNTAYYSTPTEFQEASYSTHLIHLVRTNNSGELEHIFKSGTISSNPCNSYGESLLHNVCRRGNVKLLQIMLQQAGSRIQVCDDYGRTPLHDACWTPTPCFDLIELLLEQDPFLIHMIDMRGSTALSYVQRSSWTAWKKFLDAKKDKFWPVGGQHRELPVWVTDEPNSRLLLEPTGNPEVAAMVASCKLTPEEAVLLLENDEEGSVMSSEDGDDDESDCDSDDDDDDDSWEEDIELAQIVQNHMRFV